jgi:hypothetical protein
MPRTPGLDHADHGEGGLQARAPRR